MKKLSGLTERAFLNIALAAALAAAAAFAACERKEAPPAPGRGEERVSDETFPVPSIEFLPERYVCRRTLEPIDVDGKLDEESWDKTLWTSDFVNITGMGATPPDRTHLKMLWDQDYLYIGAEIFEPDIWGNMTGRDAEIHLENDFEIFIDPNGDSHEYYEIDVNALGTVSDLFMVRPYRDGGPAIRSWDIRGLLLKVDAGGTVNRPGDTDTGWTFEAAIPWTVLAEGAHRKVPPDEGEIWRFNFCRTEWPLDVEDGKYLKKTEFETGQPMKEIISSWSPQGIEDMHYPEMWGFVIFTHADRYYAGGPPTPGMEEKAQWAMRRLYYSEKTHFLQYGTYSRDIGVLGMSGEDVYGFSWPPRIDTTGDMFEAVLESDDGSMRITITNDGKLVTTVTDNHSQ